MSRSADGARARALASAVAAVALAVGLAPLAACSSMQKAAKDDPMRCERDPKCEKKRTRAADCSAQCSDDPACVDRCEQFRRASPVSPLGR